MGGFLGIRSSSGSLDKQFQKRFPVIQTARKLYKMAKEKEKLFMRFFKVAQRKRICMLLLCAISAAILFWVLNVGEGEESKQVDNVQNNNVNESIVSLISNMAFPPSPPNQFLGYTLPPGHPCNSFTLPPPPADKKRSGPRPCPVCYLPVEEAIALMPKFPSPSPVLQNLTFIHEETLKKDGEFGGSDFGGYPTLKQRTYSHTIQPSMNIHCGFVPGPKPGRNTGYDMDEDDLLYMEQCTGVVVASCIFGNFDEINEPSNISEYSKNTVCFLMFIDEETEKYQRSSGRLDSSKKIGVWRIIVTRNPPYTDGRRTGKIPKLLIHRMAPNARYSIWLDGKLELVVDPYQILERFLWRKNATFAISRHYKRFDVFLEAEANKAAGKYDNASIDFQIEFYKNEGLTPYTEDKYPIISDVPEGCVIVRELVPISNLFTCLWFNEVDRFTSRDQISFSTVRDKLLSQVDFHFNMFLDCERRNFVVQKYHRDVLEALHAPPSQPLSPPLPLLPPQPPLLISPPEMGDPGQQWTSWPPPPPPLVMTPPEMGDPGEQWTSWPPPPPPLLMTPPEMGDPGQQWIGWPPPPPPFLMTPPVMGDPVQQWTDLLPSRPPLLVSPPVMGDPGEQWTGWPPPLPPPLLMTPPVMGDPGQQWTDWRSASMYNRKIFPGNGYTGAT